MKHGTRFWEKKLGRSPSHRKDLLKNLITSLVEHETITTTVAKAKFMQRATNIMISKAKAGDVDYVKNSLFNHDKTIPIVFDTLVKRYQDRPGYCTRILRNGYHSSGSDRAPVAIVEFVDHPKDIVYHLAKYQSPKIKEDLLNLQQEKYHLENVQLLDPVTGEPSLVQKKRVKMNIPKHELKKLNLKETSIHRTLNRYDRVVKNFTKARQLDSSSTPNSNQESQEIINNETSKVSDASSQKKSLLDSFKSLFIASP